MSILILTACTKQVLTQNKDGKEKDELTGTWQWVQSDGGLWYHIETPASSGKEIILQFADSTYAIYINNTVTSQGTYHIESRTCIHDQTQKPFLYFSAGQGLMIEAQNSDTLILSDENYDGMESVYTKKLIE